MKVFTITLTIIICLCTAVTLQAQTKQTPVKTTITNANGVYTINRGGAPYFIKGAGGTTYMDRLAKYGGNSIRTWNTTNGDEILNRAAGLGLTVTMGLNVARQRHGFDYNDTIAVKKQLEKLRSEVRQYRNHPALLAWGIGNELNLEYTNEKVWDAVNDIANMIHNEDPNHLVTTMLAGAPAKEINLIKEKCPTIDLLSLQVYGGLGGLPEALTKAGYQGPYMVTEWGPTGHWETTVTPWKAAVEETSSQKAHVYKTRYEKAIAQDKRCVGSYVFLWGQKQERTPTWYGLFTEQGEETEVIDELQYLWTGKYPANRAPHLTAFLLDGKKATDFIYTAPGKTYPITLQVTDADGDPLNLSWELLHESTDLKSGGDREGRPKAIPGLVTTTATNQHQLTTPAQPGAYRLFIYASDGNNNVATANIPFYVQ